MKIYASIKSESGKVKGIGGDKCLEIDVMVGNTMLDRLTLRRGEIQDEGKTGCWVLEDDRKKVISFLADKKKGQTTQGGQCFSMAHSEDIKKYGHCLECQRTK